MKKKNFSQWFASLTMVAIALGVIVGCSNTKTKMEKELKNFIKNYETKIIPLSKEASLAYWNASISGKDEDYKKAEDLNIQLTNIYANKEDFAKLKEIKDANAISDPLMKRQLDVLYNAYLSNQVDTMKLAEIIKLQTEIEKKYSNFRAEINGKQLSDNDIESVLQTSTNSDECKNAWMAHKKIGTVVGEDIKKLVKLRNEVAKELGFSNYHEMSLQLSEQDPKEIEKIFTELDSLTRPAFAQVKSEIDDYLAKKFNIKKEKLMPWHYQNRFFQEAPTIYKTNLDQYYTGKNLVKLTDTYYKSMGIDISDVISRSDLFEKPGKNQHAYCIDIDNNGDVRVLCNIKPNSKWMNTMLHENGHAAYDKYIDNSLPFSLRNPAHIFTTEAIAQMFGRFASNPQWMKDILNIPEEEKNKISEDCFKTLRLEQLVFSRWAQVMYNFEKQLYTNPDQDINALWWTLVEKYQMVKPPAGRNEPDWASKIHIATSPCYYHNYLLGELLASQLYHYIGTNILKSEDMKNQDFFNNPEVGKYLIEKVFQPGSKYYWNDMIEKATGEKLTAKYYAKQFVN
ncbi:MAG: M2 family metallopeptidase [Lentimicrobiaceae bacterium]|nr:M2 family metallopeptidase [Lentimicrobiaceae bacterium]